MKFTKIVDATTFRFVIVGIFNTILGASIMFLSYNLIGLNYWLSSALNYTLSSIFSFFMNKFFTFKDENKNLKQIIKFIANITVCYLFSYSIAKPLTTNLLQGFDFSVSLTENISMLIGMVLFTICNYFGQKFFVFNS